MVHVENTLCHTMVDVLNLLRCNLCKKQCSGWLSLLFHITDVHSDVRSTVNDTGDFVVDDPTPAVLIASSLTKIKRKVQNGQKYGLDLKVMLEGGKICTVSSPVDTCRNAEVMSIASLSEKMFQNMQLLPSPITCCVHLRIIVLSPVSNIQPFSRQAVRDHIPVSTIRITDSDIVITNVNAQISIVGLGHVCDLKGLDGEVAKGRLKLKVNGLAVMITGRCCQMFGAKSRQEAEMVEKAIREKLTDYKLGELRISAVSGKFHLGGTIDLDQVVKVTGGERKRNFVVLPFYSSKACIFASGAVTMCGLISEQRGKDVMYELKHKLLSWLVVTIPM